MGGTPSTGTPHSRQPAYFIGGCGNVKRALAAAAYERARGTFTFTRTSTFTGNGRARERAGNGLILGLSGGQLLDGAGLEVGGGGGGYPAFRVAEAGQPLLDVSAFAIDDVMAALDAVHG